MGIQYTSHHHAYDLLLLTAINSFSVEYVTYEMYIIKQGVFDSAPVCVKEMP